MTICFLIAAILAGCSMPRRDSIDKQSFLLEVDHPETAVSQPVTACFNIRITRVAPAFSGRQLVYRVGPVSYEQDYYNTFLSSPDEQFDELIERWFRDSARFVCQGAADKDGRILTMEPHVYELYADFQDETSPASVAKMHFYVTRNAPDSNRQAEVLKKTFTVRTPIVAQPSPNDIVRAMSLSIQQILLQLEAEIVEQLQSGSQK
jgi:uncharacterized lipoprotein YmbA